MVGGDRASGGVREDGSLGVAGGACVVVVEVFVVVGAEQDEVVEFGLAARVFEHVVGLEVCRRVQPGYWQCLERLMRARIWA